jgi:hypothetical protein
MHPILSRTLVSVSVFLLSVVDNSADPSLSIDNTYSYTSLQFLSLCTYLLIISSIMIGFARAIQKSARMPVSACFSSSTAALQPIVELREYVLRPEHSTSYMQATADTSDLRKSLAPLRFFSLPETGGQLHVATHAYYYEGGHAERDAKRALMGANPDWKAYIGKCRPFADTQQSNIYVEAPLVSSGVQGLANIPDQQPGDNSILEIRRYKLKLGYDTVPKFLEFYGAGLPSKLNAAGTDPTTSLVTLMYTEVGRMNEVIEIWRHGNGTLAMEQSRVAARGAQEWRQAIASIADLAIEFTSTIHKPTGFSPIN